MTFIWDLKGIGGSSLGTRKRGDLETLRLRNFETFRLEDIETQRVRDLDIRKIRFLMTQIIIDKRLGDS